MNGQAQTRTQRASRNIAQLAIWTAVWVATLALAKFGPELLWNSQRMLSWIAVAISVAGGAGWIVAHARYLRGLDELQRKVVLDATALALGIGLIGGFAYAVASGAHLIAFNDSILFISVLMSVVYVGATVIGNLRYR